MQKIILKLSFIAILFGLGNPILAEDKSCCMVVGAEKFTLSEEDKVSLQEEKESEDSKTSKEKDQSNKEK